VHRVLGQHAQHVEARAVGEHEQELLDASLSVIHCARMHSMSIR
jgi:hypothetical protein